ncbi:hypothetical protein ACXPWS_26900 [Mycobacterium sp. BMJ-28]
MMHLVLVIDIHGDVDQSGLDRLRASLGLHKQGRLSDDWDQEFGYRIDDSPGDGHFNTGLLRQFDNSWNLQILSTSQFPSGSAELEKIGDELVRAVEAAGFRATVRNQPEPQRRYTEKTADGGDSTQQDAELSTAAGKLIEPIVQELAVLGPASWDSFTATFAVAGPAEVATLIFARGDDSTPIPVPREIMGLVREHRAVSGRMSAGPWWRMRLEVDNRGQVSQHFDYGDEPFPEDQLFRPEDYRADLEAFPRRRVPVWLAGYVEGPVAQGRSPDRAVAAARADAENGVSGTPTDDIVPLEEAWARWAVLAAVRAGLRRITGAWIEPATAIFENGAGSGATLCVLPRERAVLSGGLWNSPLLDAAYNGGGALPQLYDGAPEWVTDSVLNPRSQRGALTFCYWWFDGRWYRGGTDTFDELDDPLPAIWTDEEAVDAIAAELGAERRELAMSLIAAAHARTASRSELAAMLVGADADLDAAYDQLSLAGLAP